MLFQTGFSLRELVTDAFEKAGVVPRVLHTSEQLSTVESLIRSGTASGFLLRPLACGDASLAAIPLTPPVCVQVSLVWRRSRKPFVTWHGSWTCAARRSCFDPRKNCLRQKPEAVLGRNSVCADAEHQVPMPKMPMVTP